MTFKVGDKVVRVGNLQGSLWVGAVREAGLNPKSAYTVARYSPSTGVYLQELRENFNSCHFKKIDVDKPLTDYL